MNRRQFIGASGSAILAGCLNAGSVGNQPDGSPPRSQESPESSSTQGPLSAKVDIHAHLREGGGQEMADQYAALGFDVLVGTDHHYDIDVPGDVEAETVGDYSDLEFPGPVLDGVELSADHHVNVIKSENEIVKQINHPMRYDDTAEDINQLAEQIGADLVEVTDHAEELSAYPTIAEAVEELDPMPTVGSDAHSTDAVGAGYVVVEVEELTGDNIIRGLKDGRYSIGGELW